MLAISLVAAVIIASVHIIGDRLHASNELQRRRWLSAAGGASVAYVFVHLLPELAQGQRVLRESIGGIAGWIEHHVYLVALAGLMVFYGVERAAKLHASNKAPAAHSVFWLHIATFTFYNATVGYLLVAKARGEVIGRLAFGVAMALHFLVTDNALRAHHRQLYVRVGRWILAFAVLLGWGIAVVATVSEAVLAALLAFLGGGIVLNVLKEELPDEQQSRFGAFLVGGAAYAALVLVGEAF